MVKLYAEKRADLEEQQLHLNVGLGKIAETVEQVEEMQKSLAVKSQVLSPLRIQLLKYQLLMVVYIVLICICRNYKPRMRLLTPNYVKW